MAILKRELAFKSWTMAANDGDWWHLVFNTDHPGLWVEHSWERANAAGQPQSGSERFGVNDFLTFRDNEIAHEALMGALALLFEPPRVP